MYEGILAISFIIVYDIIVQPYIFIFFLVNCYLMIMKHIKPYAVLTKIKPILVEKYSYSSIRIGKIVTSIR
jgi:hypothetical protein